VGPSDHTTQRAPNGTGGAPTYSAISVISYVRIYDHGRCRREGDDNPVYSMIGNPLLPCHLDDEIQKQFIDLNGNCVPLNKCLITTHAQRPSLTVANRCCILLMDRMTVTLNPCKLWLSDSEHLSASAHLARTVTVIDNPRSPRRPLHSIELCPRLPSVSLAGHLGSSA